MLGVDKPDAMLSLSSFEMLHHGKTVMGSFIGGLKPKSHVPILLQRCMDKVMDLIFLSSSFVTLTLIISLSIFRN